MEITNANARIQHEDDKLLIVSARTPEKEGCIEVILKSRDYVLDSGDFDRGADGWFLRSGFYDSIEEMVAFYGADWVGHPDD